MKRNTISSTNVIRLCLLLFLSSDIYATDNNGLALTSCTQIYLPKPLVPGTVAQCKQDWEQFTRQKRYCALFLMQYNGLGGQTRDLKKALQYADKCGSTDNAENDILLVLPLDDLKTGHGIAKKLVACDFTGSSEADSGTCPGYADQDLQNKIMQVNAEISKTWSTEQKQRLNNLYKIYGQLINDDIDTSSSFFSAITPSGDSGGWGYKSPVYEIMMLKMYWRDINNLANNYPKALATKDNYTNLNNQLNMIYKNQMKAIDKAIASFEGNNGSKVPCLNGICGSKKVSHLLKLALTKSQRDWVTYKNQYLDLVKSIYAGKYKDDDINQTVSAYLTNERLYYLNNILDWSNLNFDFDKYLANPGLS